MTDEKMPTREASDRMRRQAKILEDLALRFRGEYAWIEKVGSHACDVAMIMEETTRKSRLLADDFDALLDERDRLKAAMATAGLECFMSDATPQQVADHMRAVSTSWANEQKTIEDLRARIEKLEATLRKHCPAIAEKALAAAKEGT